MNRSLLLIAALAASLAEAAPRCVVVAGTNDFHGHVDPETRTSGDRAVHLGGAAALAGYLSILRKHFEGQLVLVDAGDLFQGTLVSNSSEGAAVIAAYNALGYQAVALGNHEFDFGPDKPPEALQGALKRRLTEAHFPVLAANLYERATHKRPPWKNLAASTLLVANGVKVGLIGAITPTTPTVTSPVHVPNLEFRDPAPEVVSEAAALRKRGAEVVVLVSHIGGACADRSNPDDTSTCDQDSELFKLLARLPAGTVDVVVGGHTHQYIAHRVGTVAVIESGSYGRSFGWLEACVGENGQVAATIHPPQDLCAEVWNDNGCTGKPVFTPKPATFLGEPIPGKAEALTLALAPFRAKVRDVEAAETGVTIASPLARERDRSFPLGSLIARSMLRAMPQADVAVTNSGGIRNGLPAGAIAYGRLFEVLPFDNRLVLLELTGAQLKEFVLAPLRAGHGFPQLAGVTLEYDGTHGSLRWSNGKPVGDEQKLHVVTNDFLAAGGDGTAKVVASLSPQAQRQTGLSLREIFLEYLKSLPQPVAVQN